MVNHSQVSEELARYLNGRISLDSFEDWVVMNTWNIHQANDRKAENLVFAIEESLAEHSSGHLSESQLQAELRSIILAPEPSRLIAFEVGRLTPSPRSSATLVSATSLRV
jgi:hypothetical protein